ncbi:MULTISPECIES: helix-turn-helix domain-containing protein [unclassified Colwellia]|uniref:helix-turn-helix domain-containing protein n=1 Tax=unclassified Colwellia TaxID=196834 RepID=UPI0015F6350A|nr:MULTISPECIES: helix-turn-helix domain-containing protein [unclassified Colwellia]MBA6377601.1 helix-turn-helix domain-containing protein [Colwellia sp. BRX10-7]MBA6386473.1 helix-turn-helix domain-containing protein [Colwellia sp. BRX10-2]MBA6401741.1 helix-turn-helix domain-containing protein [Colwellia sp. BRX10-5]MBA6404235.1 helix-turn-helix domain-containing protein [Colwellia sp. BRX10-1]
MYKPDQIDNHKSIINLFDKAASKSKTSGLQSSLSQRQTNALLDNAPICIKILDTDFNLKYMSPAGIKSLGINDINNFYGQAYPFDFYPQLFCDDMTESLNRAVTTNKIVKQEASIVDLKGNELRFHSTIIPVESESGQNQTLLVISIEVPVTNEEGIELSTLKNLQENVGEHFTIEHSNKNINSSFMAKVENIVLVNMNDNNFDVNALAEHLFMSRSTLQRKLKAEIGESAAVFIRQKRLSKAHELIQSKVHKTLTETAYSVGFKHIGNFSTLYKKYQITIKNQ